MKNIARNTKILHRTFASKQSYQHAPRQHAPRQHAPRQHTAFEILKDRVSTISDMDDTQFYNYISDIKELNISCKKELFTDISDALADHKTSTSIGNGSIFAMCAIMYTLTPIPKFATVIGGGIAYLCYKQIDQEMTKKYMTIQDELTNSIVNKY